MGLLVDLLKPITMGLLVDLLKPISMGLLVDLLLDHKKILGKWGGKCEIKS